MCITRRLTAFYLYLFLIGTLGSILVAWGLLHIPTDDTWSTFALLVVLAIVAAIAPISTAVSEDTGMSYGLGAIVSLAAFPKFGNGIAVLIVATYSTAVWFSKPVDRRTWKKNFQQLIFNISMQAIAIFIAGEVYILVRNAFGPESPWGQIVPWIPAALIYEEVNLWLLIGVVRLQQGPSVRPLQLWREERSASQILLIASIMGGGTLGYAVEHHGNMGVFAFFWPILLSAYALRLYIQQVRANVENLENMVAERTRDLADLNRQKDAYLAVLTHDMMTPLTSIQLCAEELQADPAAAIDNPSLINFLLRSQRTLFTMVRNILDIEKLQTGGALSSRRSTCDIALSLRQAAELLENEAGEKNVSITRDIAMDHLPLYADCGQLERIIMNLLSNAVKYTPQGGQIGVSLVKEGKWAIISIADTGYGIPEHELPYIFERFRRVEEHVEKATGSGLGLAITKALVEEHHGEVTVESTIGKGSTFTVRLPLTAPPA
ncbi:MAG: HAMP domain-containing histidine kinase [Caldilineaceae bacterium]|nr:HAMP domain-containing histidine kinase [Caldilineaceae bacterium]